MTDQEKELLLKKLIPYVWRLANRWYRTVPLCERAWLDVEDLHAIGIAKIYRSLDTYDPNKNATCTTYMLHIAQNEWRDMLTSMSRVKRRMPGQMVYLDAGTKSEESDVTTLELEDTRPAPVDISVVEIKVNAVFQALDDDPEAKHIFSACFKRSLRPMLEANVLKRLLEVLKRYDLSMVELAQLQSIAQLS